ncbi:MAG TPA: hypothetical protein VF076_02465 [Acidimicrobiales bacterium]
MFTTMQSLQVAHEIQADHRRRATTWRFARRAHRRAQQPEELVTAVPSGPGPARFLPSLAPVVPLRARTTPPVTNVA